MALNVAININQESRYSKYTPLNPTVRGTFSIEWDGDISSDTFCSLYYGLRGYVIATCTSVTDVKANGGRDSDGCDFGLKDYLVKEKHMLFNKQILISNNNNETHINRSFDISFPSNPILPSSCVHFGSNLHGYIAIIYEFYILEASNDKKKKHTGQYFIEALNYQSRSISRFSFSEINNLHYKDHHIFKNKLKKYYFDDEKNEFVANPMKGRYKNTRIIRRIWDKNYSSPNYNVFTKNVDLLIELQLDQFIDICKPVLSSFSFLVKSNFDNIDELIFEKQSTKLGYFEIKGLDILINYNSHYKVEGSSFKVNHSELIHSFSFQRKGFDIIDFQYDEIKKTRTKIVQIKDEFDLSLMELVKDKNLMCNCILEHYFRNDSRFELKLIIDDTNGNCKTFKFKTDSTPDILNLPENDQAQLDYEYRPPRYEDRPPMYEDRPPRYEDV